MADWWRFWRDSEAGAAKALAPRQPQDAPKPRKVFVARAEKPTVNYATHMAAIAAIQHPVTARAIRYIARAVQVVDWYAEAEAPNSANKRDVADLNALLVSPHNELTPANLRFWLAVNLAVYNRATIKVGVDANGKLPSGIYPLDSDLVSRVMNGQGRLTGFEYGQGNGKDFFPVRYPTRSNQPGGWAYQIATPGLSADLTEEKYGLAPLRSLGIPAAVITALLKRTLATAEGHPNSKYIVSYTDVISEEQKEEVEEYAEDRETYGERSGDIMFINGDVEVHRLDNDLSDAHGKQPLDDMSRMIAGMFGIPIALWGLGAADAAKYASNYQESRAAFYEDTIIPEYLSPMADAMTSALCPPGIRIRFDLDSIPAMIRSRLASAKELNEVTFLTDDEKREILGFAPIKQEGSNNG